MNDIPNHLINRCHHLQPRPQAGTGSPCSAGRRTTAAVEAEDVTDVTDVTEDERCAVWNLIEIYRIIVIEIRSI